MISFCAVTSHFINENGKLDSYLLEFSQFFEDHTGHNIQSWINEVMENFDIKEKVVAIVTDNAKNITFAVSMLNIQHIACFAHSLNLIIKNGILKTISKTIEKVKAIVRHF